MPHPAFEHLRTELEAEIVMVAEGLSAGICENFESYKFQAGFIAGIKKALRLVEDAEQKEEEEFET